MVLKVFFPVSSNIERDVPTETIHVNNIDPWTKCVVSESWRVIFFKGILQPD